MDEAIRNKRMRMRSWRRGTREMDLILGPFADSRLQGLDAGQRDAFEALLDENDQDLYAWILARKRGEAAPVPAHLRAILDLVADEALARLGGVDKI